MRTESTTRLLGPEAWGPLAAAHRARAQRWTVPHLERRHQGVSHPVEDFLFQYYNLSPGALERWHPGRHVGLVDSAEHAALGAYVTIDGVSRADLTRVERRLSGLRWTAELLRRTAERPGRWGCFGLHEWAMVYRQPAERRHDGVPLRLGAAGTDEVVRSHQLACTHVDAFRFFTPEGAERNPVRLTREVQLEHEQPGCLHVTMDLYRTSSRLLPFVESSIVLDTFELACDARQIDMRASPYDLREFGLDPIAVETPEGKATYVREQRRLAELAAPLRQRLLEHVTDLLTESDSASH